jgi:hypothetical protein
MMATWSFMLVFEADDLSEACQEIEARITEMQEAIEDEDVEFDPTNYGQMALLNADEKEA